MYGPIGWNYSKEIWIISLISYMCKHVPMIEEDQTYVVIKRPAITLEIMKICTTSSDHPPVVWQSLRKSWKCMQHQEAICRSCGDHLRYYGNMCNINQPVVDGSRSNAVWDPCKATVGADKHRNYCTTSW